MFVFCVVLCCGLDGGSEKGGFPRASDGNWEGVGDVFTRRAVFQRVNEEKYW
jgi:hypothetical protein